MYGARGCARDSFFIAKVFGCQGNPGVFIETRLEDEDEDL